MLTPEKSPSSPLALFTGGPARAPETRDRTSTAELSVQTLVALKLDSTSQMYGQVVQLLDEARVTQVARSLSKEIDSVLITGKR